MDSHHASAGPNPIDTAVLDELRLFQEEGGPDILGELIDIFLDDTPGRLQDMQQAVNGGDAESSESAAHALKSSCAQLGALHLSELCRQVEMAGKARDLTGMVDVARAAGDEYARVRDALTRLKDAA